ncbi:MAG: hypothetical protein U0271_39890 [Polyangiaceae bacterium]
MSAREWFADGFPRALALTRDAVVWLDLGDRSQATAKGPYRLVATPKRGGPSRTLAVRDRPLWTVGATDHFVVFTEETSERYVTAAFVVDMQGGEPQQLPFAPGLVPPVAIAESVFIASGDQLYEISGSEVAGCVRGLVEECGAASCLGMANHAAVSGTHAYWSTTGDSAANAAIHRAALTGSVPSPVLELPPDEGAGHLALVEDTLYFTHCRQDTSVGRVLESSLRAMNIVTGETRMIASLDRRSTAALTSHGHTLYWVRFSRGGVGDVAGLFRVDAATGVITEIDASIPTTAALAADDEHVYVGTHKGIVRYPHVG